VRLVGEEWVRSQAQISVQRSLSLGVTPTRGLPLPAGGEGRGEGAEGTSTRSLLGTYEYMSPEQKRGEEVDARSDIYALGLMTFKLRSRWRPDPKCRHPRRRGPRLSCRGRTRWT
jgi:serine/threonine protein kinase